MDVNHDDDRGLNPEPQSQEEQQLDKVDGDEAEATTSPSDSASEEDEKAEVEDTVDPSETLTTEETDLAVSSAPSYRRFIKPVTLSVGAMVIFAVLWNYKFGEDAEPEDVSLEPGEIATKILSGEEDQFHFIPGIEKTIELIEGGAFEPEVTEFEDRDTGNFTYAFRDQEDQKEEVPEAQEDKGEKTEEEEEGATEPEHPYHILKGVEPGEARERLLEKLTTSEFDYNTTQLKAISKTTWWDRLYGFALLAGIGYIAWQLIKRLPEIPGSGGAGDQINPHLGVRANLRQLEGKEGFDSIGGNFAAKEEFQDMLRDIQKVMNGDPYVKLPAGGVMKGPPGTGKTMFARTLAQEAGCPLLFLNSGEIVSSSYMGTWISELLKVCSQGREQRDALTKELRARPGATGNEEGVVIIFIDELEMIGAKRKEDPTFGGYEEGNKLVDAMLQELDGVDAGLNANVIFVGATNNYGLLDPALVRPGRMGGFTIEINLPDSVLERKDIIEKRIEIDVESRGKQFEDEEIIDSLAELTPQYSGARLAEIVGTSWTIANREDRDLITWEDLFESYQRETFGRPSPQHLYSKEMQRRVNIHEMGHLVAGLAFDIEPYLYSNFPRSLSPARVILDPRGRNEGVLSRYQYIQEMVILAGGIAAEIVNYPEEGPSDGASSDLSRLREIGIHLISQGMFGGHLAAVDISQLRPGDYPPEYMTALNDLVEGVISFSINLLTSVPKEITEGFVSGAMALTTEPAGPRAVDFRKAHIPDQFCADLRSKGKELLVRSKEFVQGKPVLAERVKETEVSSLS